MTNTPLNAVYVFTPNELEAYRKKHELQARIDELAQVPELKWDNHNHCLDPHHRTDRLGELKQELEKYE